MKYFIRILVLSSIIFLIKQNQATAEMLVPPKLSQVITQNENYQKTVKKTIRKQKIVTSPVLWAIEILSYHTIDTGKAITLSKYDNIDLWVQEIDLSKWWKIEAELKLWWYDEISGEPLFEKQKISDVRSSLNQTPFSIFNWQFFDPKRSLTPLSFGIKINGVVRTAWADNRDESKNILIINNTIAKIVPYSWENLRDAPWNIAIVNLSLTQWHYKNENIGRTYICLKNPNTQNESSTVLVFTATAMTEAKLETEILRWWCTRESSTKLDSSWSTRLWNQNVNMYGYSHNGNPDYRKIPNSLIVYDSSI